MLRTALRKVKYEEWESVIDVVGGVLKRYGTAYRDSKGDYLLIQSWLERPIIDLIITDLVLSDEIIADIVNSLGVFQPDWRVWVTYYEDHLRWEEHESIAITRQVWYPVDNTCRRIW